MKLSDVVSHSGLAGYAEIALILFALAFVGIVIRVVARSRREVDHMARLPLDDGTPEPRSLGEES